MQILVTKQVYIYWLHRALAGDHPEGLTNNPLSNCYYHRFIVYMTTVEDIIHLGIVFKDASLKLEIIGSIRVCRHKIISHRTKVAVSFRQLSPSMDNPTKRDGGDC